MIRALNPKAKTILKVATPLAVAAFVLFIWANARPVPVQVRVTFIGFTNPPTIAFIEAYYCVSNAGRCTVVQEGRKIEIKNQLDVNVVGVVAGGMYALKPGEFQTISFFSPTREPSKRVDNRGNLVLQTNLEPWRLSLLFSKVDWREKLARNPPWVLRKVLRFVPAKWLEPQTIEVHSDWINGPELMPVATNTAKAVHE